MGQFCRHVTPSFPQHVQAWRTVPALGGGPVACPPASVVPGGESCRGSGGVSPSPGAVAPHQGWTPVFALVTAPWEHPGHHWELQCPTLLERGSEWEHRSLAPALGWGTHLSSGRWQRHPGRLREGGPL